MKSTPSTLRRALLGAALATTLLPALAQDKVVFATNWRAQAGR